MYKWPAVGVIFLFVKFIFVHELINTRLFPTVLTQKRCGAPPFFSLPDEV